MDLVEFKEALGKVEKLSTLPHVITRIGEMVQNPRTSAEDLNRVISQDPSLTAQVLKLANSPLHGLTRTISTITQAVVILGFNAVKNAAITATVFKMFFGKKSDADGDKGFDRRELWTHSVAVGVCAQVIAQHIGRADKEEFFIAGLLHDLGKVVMDQHLHEEFEKVLSVVEREDLYFIEAEDKVLGFDHCAVGQTMVENWHMPKRLAQAVAHHHRPEEAEYPGLEAAAVHLANVLCRGKRVGSGGDQLVPQLVPTACKTLELRVRDVEPLMNRFEEEFAQASDFLML